MQTPVIFLDVDGVLNAHEFDTVAMSAMIERPMMQRLSWLIRLTRSKVVLSSAWRYIVLRGEAQLSGMDWLLRSHGFPAKTLIGCTREDTMTYRPGYTGEEEWPVDNERGLQIADWRSANEHTGPYVVLDDLDLGINSAGHPFVQTNGKVGLTATDAEAALSAFRFQGVVPLSETTAFTAAKTE